MPDSSHLQNGFYLELRGDQGLYPRFRELKFAASKVPKHETECPNLQPFAHLRETPPLFAHAGVNIC